METKTLAGPRTAVAWLERCTAGNDAERLEIEQFPFTLGRAESCDYSIPSSRVSREHAEISRAGDHYVVRDLGSTNGTFVNGERIQGGKLCEGDMLVIADVEFTFHCPSDDGVRRTVTQVMAVNRRPLDDGGEDGVEDEGAQDGGARDLIRMLRARQETILHCAARNRFQPIVEIAAGLTVGYEAISRPQIATLAASGAERTLQSIDCRLTERTHHLHRLLAAEQAARIPGEGWLFLLLQPAEVGADLLPETLARLQQLAPNKRIVAEIPNSAVVDIPYFRDFRARLRELHIELAYDGFMGGQHQVKAQQEFPPNFLKLAPALARGVDRSSQRQQQIRSLVDAAGEIGAHLIATGVHSENEAQTCRELGCRLAQGDHYGSPQTMHWPAEGWGLSV